MQVGSLKGRRIQGKTDGVRRKKEVSGQFLHSRIPPVENGFFRLDFFPTAFFWFFLSSAESIL